MVTQIQLGTIFSQNGKTIVGGGASGIDTKSLIDGLVEAKSQPAVTLQASIDANQKKVQAFTTMKTMLQQFQSAANFLRNPPGVQNANSNVFAFRSASVTASDGSTGGAYLTATVEAGTPIQNYTIDEITKLAVATKQQSNTFVIANVDTVVVSATPGAGEFGAGTITFAGGATLTLNAGDTLRNVAAKFNAISDDTGISATILQVASGQFKLTFTATETGTDAAFDLKNAGTVTADPSGVLTNVTINTTQPADNAAFKIDGIPITSQSNTVTGVIDGITLNLKQLTPAATTLSLDIAPDRDLAKTAITNYLDAYNAFRLFYAQQTAVSDDGTPKDTAILHDNSALRTFMNQISTQVSGALSGIGAGGYTMLGDVGVSFTDYAGDDETPFTRNILTVDDAQLASALASNFNDVENLFGFQLTSTDANLQAFAHTKPLGVNYFTLSINQTTSTYTATYGSTTVNLDAAPITGGGITLTGQSGTALEGLVLIYSSTGNATITVSATQGFADSLYNTITDTVTDDTGTIAQELKTINDADTRSKADIERITQQVEDFREQLIAKYSALEAALTRVNNLLESLNAQAQARFSAAGG